METATDCFSRWQRRSDRKRNGNSGGGPWRYGPPPLLLLLLLPAVAAPPLSAAPEEAKAPCPPVVVAINAHSPVQEISVGDLQAIYAGQRTRWPGGSRILAIAAPPRSTLAHIFNDAIFGERLPAGFQRNSPLPFRPLELNPADAVQYVSMFPNAIMYAAHPTPHTNVRWLAIEGLPGNDRDECRPPATDPAMDPE